MKNKWLFGAAAAALVDAAAADEAYIRAANASPIYHYGYYPHNLHFVLTSAAMGGDQRTTLQYAERLDSELPIEMARALALAQPVKAAPWFARAQFATPASILAASAPPEGVALVTGAWRRRMRGDRQGAYAARILFNSAFLGPRGGVTAESL